MNYRVEYMPRVVAAIESQVVWLRDQGASDDRIATWLTGLVDLAESLVQNPRRYPVAELESRELGVEIRRIVVGDYLFYYQVDDAQQCVNVLHFRHSAHETGGIVSEADDL